MYQVGYASSKSFTDRVTSESISDRNGGAKILVALSWATFAYMNKAILITGPECSGKTTLCEQLQEALQIPLLTEYSREYLPQLDRAYTEADLLIMAQKQEEMHTVARAENELTLLDTGLLVYKVWSQEKYGHCDPWIAEQWQSSKYDLILLCAPDMPYEADPLRESEGKRQELFHTYEMELKRAGKKFDVMEGPEDMRLEYATMLIETFVL